LGTAALAVVAAASAAFAADMPRKAPLAPYAGAPFNWTGFYIDAHVGAGWSTKEWTVLQDGLPPIPVGNFNLNGFLGGGQIGYNWQSGWAVFGVEADASAADLKGSAVCIVVVVCSSKIDALGTITARFGGAVDRALVYVKGGGAWAHEKNTAGLETSESATRWGWTVGTGVEYAFAPNWSGKIEYNFLDFGKANFFRDFIAEGVSFDIRQTVHTVKFGLNYRFGGPMVGGY
jgi:outer membrane immunogenic protein